MSMIGLEHTIFLLGMVLGMLSWNGEDPSLPDRKVLRGVGAFFMSGAMIIALVDGGWFVHAVVAVRNMQVAILWLILLATLYAGTAAVHRLIVRA